MQEERQVMKICFQQPARSSSGSISRARSVNVELQTRRREGRSVMSGITKVGIEYPGTTTRKEDGMGSLVRVARNKIILVITLAVD